VLSRTFCTIITDPAADAVLAPYGELWARIRHWSFKQIHVLQRPVADVKREALHRFHITARQFNGIRVDLDQAVNGAKGTAAFTVQRLKDSIEATEARIATLGRRMDKAKTERARASAKFRQVGKKQRLDVLRGQLQLAEKNVSRTLPAVCFGGREALRRGDVTAWRDKRTSRIFLVGAADDGRTGNQSVHWDGENLRLRMPDALGGHMQTLTGVQFRYGQGEMLAVLARNADKKTRISLSWLIFRDELGRWHAHVTVDEVAVPLLTDVRHGVLAVDLNVDHLAVTMVDHWGNPVDRLTVDFPPSGTDEGKSAAIIGDAVRALCLLARQRCYGIACEKLDFSRKKAGLREFGAAHARRLSGWSYARFSQVLEARCRREGIDLAQVNPAYTSVIGRVKYAKCRAMSVHHAAALAIGRLAIGYGERFVAMDGAVLDGPARNRPRGERRRWRSVRRLPREAVRPAVCTAGSAAGAALPGGRRGPASGPGQDPGRRRTGNVPQPAWGAVALAAGR
jgi:IS605 OrfB family transposase